MQRIRAFRRTVALLALPVLFTWSAVSARAEKGYGDFSGQFVLDKGDAKPKLEVLIAKGMNVKDKDVCAAQDLYKNDLLIDDETRGIANVFVYIRRVDKIHPSLESTPDDKKELVFDQKNCRFFPHGMCVRTDQTVLVKSMDACAHNTHTYPLRNQADNILIAPNFRKGVPIKPRVPEFLPFQVKCDIHPWMKAHWLVLDHPYMAITDEQGRFGIEKLPAGEYEFTAWHERSGYVGVDTKKGFKVTVPDDGSVELEPFQIPLATFDED